MSSNISSITASGGSFMITDSSGASQPVDLATLMMMLNIQLTETYDSQIAARMQDMQNRSSNMKKMTDALNLLRNSSVNGEYSSENIYKAEQMLKEAGMTLTSPLTQSTNGAAPTWTSAYCTNNRGDKEKVKPAYETLMENVKSTLESMGNDSQLENIKLQNVMQKRGNSFEMTTKVMDTDKQTIQSIIRNL